jgi:hypothetical protein
MVFQAIGSHSFKVSVGDPNCPSLIVYGRVLKRRPDLQLEACNVPITMTIKPLSLMQGKEKEKEEVSAKHLKEGSQHQLLSTIRTCQRFNASDVTSMATM